ncbi:MAG: T9SS type A sorting domain-containing protein [Bacteroidota bacterium]|nr:T9SS type A sorting domain-containing protein [Bacteroidota bacterium]
MNLFKIFFVIFLLFVVRKNYCQNSTVCINALPICTSSFDFALYNGAGSGLPNSLIISNPSTNPQGVNSGCLLDNGIKPRWITFSISVSGDLGFSLGANGSSAIQLGYIDWALWTSTVSLSSTCINIFNDSLAPVSCNWNAAPSGGTGMGSLQFGGDSGNYQPTISVLAGQIFVLLVSNYSGVNSNCTFSNTGTAQIAYCSTITALESNIETNNEISIYPNPFKDLIAINNNNTSQKEIEIYSILGQKINAYSSKEKTIDINTSEFLPGVYFLKVKWEDKMVLWKLIKN